MDKALLRPLFRQAALHTKQIETGNIPKYFWGGLAAMGGRLLPSLAKGYRTFRGAQTAKAAAGVPRLGQMIYRSPYTQKGILGLEAGAVGAGAEETRRGVMGKKSLYSDRPASVLGGVASLYGGAAFGARTLAAGKAIPRLAGAGAKWAGRTPAPFLLPLGFGAAGLAETGFKETVKEEKSRRIPEEKLVKLEENLKGLGENPNVQEVVKTITNFDITDKQKQAVFEELGIPLDLMPKKDDRLTTEDVAEKGYPGATSESTAPISTIEDQMIAVTPAITDTKGMSDEERNDIAATQGKAVNKANSEVARALSTETDPEFMKEFAQIKNSISQVVGNDNTANLILLKLASGLLTGKSARQGVSGLSDIIGQAMGPTVDTAMVLAQSQKEFDQNLAKDLMEQRAEYQKELLKEGRTKIDKERVYVQEINEGDSLFPVIARQVGVDQDGRTIEVIPSPQGDIFQPYSGGGQRTEVSQKTRDVSFKAMGDLKTGIEFTKIVQMAPLGSMGSKAKLREFYDNVIEAGRGASSSFSPNMEEWNYETFEQISNQIQNYNPGKEDLPADLAKKYGDEASEILGQFYKENDKLAEELSGALGSGDKERIARAQLGLIEQRMKYIIANANKETDRITVFDIKNAAERTQIFKWFGNEKQMRANYERLEAELSNKFKKKAASYVANGGTTKYVTETYKSLKPVQDWLKKRDNLELRQQVEQEDQGDILETI